MKRFFIFLILLLVISGSVLGSVIPSSDEGDMGDMDGEWGNEWDDSEPVDTSDEGVYDFGEAPDTGEEGWGGCTAGCQEGNEPGEVDSSQEHDPETTAWEDDGWEPPAPDTSPVPKDNKIKVDPTKSTAEQGKQVVKEINARNWEKIGEATGSNKPLMQRIIEGIKRAVSDLNILKIFTQPLKATLQQIAHLVVSAGGMLLGLPPGTSTMINMIIDDTVALHDAYPEGIPPTSVNELSPEAAAAIAAMFGGTHDEHIEVNDGGEFQPGVSKITVPEGTSPTKQVTIDGKVYIVTVSGDGTLVSVRSPPPSLGATQGVRTLQVGWDYGSFNSYPTGICGDGILYPVTEQCEVNAGAGIFDNPYCAQPTLCEGRLTAVRRPHADCISTTCQCLFDIPSLAQWQYIPGSCGATCNATLGCAGGQVCSNGQCGTVNLCGNGIVDVSQGEQCDGGGLLSCPSGTSCTGCQCVPTAPDCTNGLLEVGEVCDQKIPAILERQQGSNVGICRKPCESCQCTAGVSTYQTTQQGVGPYEVGGIPVELCQGKDAQGNYEPGRDDNCDGRVDEACVCTPGDTRVCGERGSTCGAGGTQTCQADGTWGVCTVTYAPQDEIYDGIDNDCDFLVDECGIIGQNMLFFNEAVWEYNTSTTTFMRITQTGINTTVYFSTFTNFSAQVPLNVTLYETDCPGSALQISCSQEVQRRNVMTNAGGEGRDAFSINDSVFTQTSTGDGKNRTFFFVVKSFGQNMTSGPLFVSESVGIIPGNGGLLDGNITGAYHGQVYLNGSAIVINHTFSRNGNLQSNWTIAEDGFRTTTDSFVHNFTTPGQKTLTLHVSNNNGGHAEVQIGFLVVPSTGGNGLMTFIDYPGYYQIIPTGRNASTTFIAGANTSFAIGGGASCGAFTCLSGPCPLATNNTDTCSGTTRSITPGPQPYSSLSFTWEVAQGGNWHLVSSGTGQFTRSITLGSNAYSNALNDKQLRVITNYTSGGVSVQSTFTRAVTLGQCLSDGYTFAVVNPHGQFVRYASTVSGMTKTAGATFSATACRGEDGINGTRDDCVPNGWKCGDTGGYLPVTNGSTTTFTFCDEYRDEPSCTAARPGSISSVVCFGQAPDASCTWEGGVCKTKYTVTNLLGDAAQCIEQVQGTADCIEGLRDVTIATSFTGDRNLCPAFGTYCENRADTLVCGRPAFELPFFGFWQLVIGLVGIVVMGIFRRRMLEHF